MKAIEHLLHLHSCEQEGISSGMPTPQQWLDAVEAAREEYNKLSEHSALKEPVAWLCEGDGKMFCVVSKETAELKKKRYTVTELVKK